MAVQGRLKEALRQADEKVRLCLSARDTAGAITAILQRSMFKLTLLKDVKGAGVEIELASTYGAASRPQSRVNFAIWYALQGDEHTVDSLVRSPRALNLALRSVASSKKHECTQAEAYYDSAVKGFVIPDAKLFLLFALATCQYEDGQNDKGLETMQRVLAMRESARTEDFGRYQLLIVKLYEKKGEKKLALESYERFLKLWNNADKDLPDLIDVKARIAKLKGNA